MTLLLVYVAFAIGVSFCCSLMEATLLSSRLSALETQRNAGNRGAGMLADVKRRRVDDAISAILILNTISNTLGATMAGSQAAQVFESRWIGLFSAFMTFAILVVSEIIPKTLGTVYWRTLSGLVGWTLAFMMRLMAPALVVSSVLTRMLTGGRSEPVSRSELAAVIDVAGRDGALSPDETAALIQMLRIKDIHVEDVMTPRTVCFMLPIDTSVDDLLKNAEAEPFSRIPIFDRDPDNIVGYVLVRDVLRAAAAGCDRQRKLATWMRQIWHVPEMIGVGAALSQFLEQRASIAVVTDEHGGVAGLVTLEDLTETMLGNEIVDEFDRHVDLRQQAAERRDRRLAHMRQQRELVSGERPGGAE